MLSESAEYDSQDPVCLENSKFSELPGHAWIFHPSKLRNPDSFPDNRQDNGLGMRLGF